MESKRPAASRGDFWTKQERPLSRSTAQLNRTNRLWWWTTKTKRTGYRVTEQDQVAVQADKTSDHYCR